MQCLLFIQEIPKVTKGEILENRYCIEDELTWEVMGAVYRAFDTNMQVNVASKENCYRTLGSLSSFCERR